MPRAGRGLVPAVALALAVLPTACGSNDDPRVLGGIVIADFTFDPNPFTADPGDKVVVLNRDGTAHTLTADDGSVDSGRIDSGDDVRIELARPGTLPYHCSIHEFMRGVIRVREPQRSSR
jgi:plastocyanin